MGCSESSEGHNDLGAQHETSGERIRKGFEIFLDDLRSSRDITESMTEHLRRRFSIDFNVFDLIKPDENRLSDILAMLLNPNGEHGQGVAYLKQFLGTFEFKNMPSEWLLADNLAVTAHFI